MCHLATDGKKQPQSIRMQVTLMSQLIAPSADIPVQSSLHPSFRLCTAPHNCSRLLMKSCRTMSDFKLGNSHLQAWRQVNINQAQANHMHVNSTINQWSIYRFVCFMKQYTVTVVVAAPRRLKEHWTPYTHVWRHRASQVINRWSASSQSCNQRESQTSLSLPAVDHAMGIVRFVRRTDECSEETTDELQQ